MLCGLRLDGLALFVVSVAVMGALTRHAGWSSVGGVVIMYTAGIASCHVLQ